MTWEEYKADVREKDPEMSKELSEAEEVAKIVSELISQRNEKGLTQRQLAEICNMPQSSVARIESFQTSPRLDTLVKLTHSLGLRLTLTPNDN